MNLGHGRKCRRLRLRRATSNDNARIRLFPFEAADGLFCLTYRFRRYCARIHDNRIVDTGSGRLAPDHFRLIGVQTAAECDDIDSHDTPALAKSVGSKRPLNSNSTGPAIKM